MTLAKAEHRDSWLGTLIQHSFTYPGVSDPGVMTWFDRRAPGELPLVISQLAEELDVPHVTGAEKLEWKDGLIRVERSSDGFREVLEVSPPALLTVFSNVPLRFPSLVEIQDAFVRNAIERRNLEDLNADPGQVGTSGSRTWVETLVPISPQKPCVFIEGDPRQQAKSLYSILAEKNLIS